MDGMVSTKRMVDGKPTSLCDLGYCDVGLDGMFSNGPPATTSRPLVRRASSPTAPWSGRTTS